MLKKLKGNHFLKAASIYTISSFLNSGITFLMLPLLTRHLTSEQYGILAMINATISILTPFVGMSISTAIERQLVEFNKIENSKYLFNSLIVAAISSTITLIIVFISRNFICKITGIPPRYLWIVFVVSISDVIISVGLVVMQFNDKPVLFGIYKNAETIMNVAISIILVVISHMALDGRLYGIVISKLIFFILGFFIVKKFVGIKPEFRIDYIKDEVFNFGIPLIPAMLKTTILTYLDRIFITNMKSISETGLYSVGNQLSLPILFLAQAFNLAYLPWLYKKLKLGDMSENRRVVKLTYIYFFLIAGIAVIWGIFASFLTIFIVGNSYKGAESYIIWLSLGYAFTGMHMMVVAYIYYSKQLKLYNIVTITVILLNVIFNYILIKSKGAIGAAQATMIVNILSFILTWVLASKVHKMPWNIINKERQENGKSIYK